MLKEPVIIAVPPKGGSHDDVMKRLAQLGWVDAELVAEIRRLVKEDKRRIKLEEGLISLWKDNHGDEAATMRAADAAGHDLDDVAQALGRMRRYENDNGSSRISFSPKAAVDEILHAMRHSTEGRRAEAAMCLHLELDLTRPGRPTRMMFDHLEFEATIEGRKVMGVLVGTEHEVTPTYLRKHKRDISLTCYDAFHNTLLDALSTAKVHNWRELMDHLIEANTDVRIMGSLGLEDYLGHFVLMPEAKAQRVASIGADRAWGIGEDPKVPLLAEDPVLIDAQYEEVYRDLLDAPEKGITFEATTEDIERRCSEEGRTSIYIVRSGSTIACTPGLCVVGSELITSETIVAVNRERLDHNPGVGALIESLQPVREDHSDSWRDKLKKRLGDKLL